MVVKLGIIGYKNHAERLLNILDKKKKYAVFSQRMFNYKINLRLL